MARSIRPARPVGQRDDAAVGKHHVGEALELCDRGARGLRLCQRLQQLSATEHVLDAGAPSDARLAALLRERLGLPEQEDGRSSLLSTMGELKPERLPDAQQAVADVISGLLLRPTPVLTALVSVPSRRVLTTNFDDTLSAQQPRGAWCPSR